MFSQEFECQLPLVVAELMPFAIKLTRNRDAAQDLCQETLCRALMNKDKFAPGTSMEAWLLVIMRNIFLNNYRRKQLHDKFESYSKHEVAHAADRNLHNNSTEMALTLKELQEGMDGLPGKFKITFQLYSQGYKYQEIADMMKEPMGTIKSRIHMAKRMLRNNVPAWAEAHA
ncbi:RNA polymerase sigma factor [Chitinophaga sp. sic0106]|uniref:RNA polymerase sigma factor n=1 Tax=Chitinophaga sp. sic0106 TaxID=2854785 RepID=UPI001C46F411|nr:RNA polymerase sigma factor [Chitinophaga sp. sic0106]MBV7530037.1 RNA polymerase sigma factor [Chitinophaga sp. sic0106]